jgi:hypothetical protein
MCWYNAQPIDKYLIVVAIGNVIHTWLNNMWCLVELKLQLYIIRVNVHMLMAS